MGLALKTSSAGFNSYLRKVVCPKHFILKPGHDPFLREPIPNLAFLKDADAKLFKISKYRRKKDRWGRAIRNPASYWSPPISAALAREAIYKSDSQICRKCKLCLEGSNGQFKEGGRVTF